MATLYSIAFTGRHPFDPVVPAGGALVILGWLGLAFAKLSTAD